MRSSDEVWSLDALPRGTTLHGYEIEAILGRGGFGITYRARDRIDQLFAVKECFPRQFAVRHGLAVLPTDAADAGPLTECLDRFLREARALVRLSQLGAAADGVVKVATFFEANGTAYLVMEYLAGQSLEALIKAFPAGLGAEALTRLLRGLLQALACVHDAGLLHRDVKPANVILRADGRPVLIDFGATRSVEMAHTMFTQIYSASYAPIEQFNGDNQGPFSDLYAVAMTCYRAIGGTALDPVTRLPIDARKRDHAARLGKPDPLPPAAVIGAGRYPQPVLRAIDAALAVAAADRPQTVADMLTMLGDDSGPDVVVTMPRPARPAGPVPPAEGDAPTLLPSAKPSDVSPGDESTSLPPRQRKGPSRAVVLGAALAAIALIVSGGLALVPWHRPADDKTVTTGGSTPTVVPSAPPTAGPATPDPTPAAQDKADDRADGTIAGPDPLQKPPAAQPPTEPPAPAPVPTPGRQAGVQPPAPMPSSTAPEPWRPVERKPVDQKRPADQPAPKKSALVPPARPPTAAPAAGSTPPHPQAATAPGQVNCIVPPDDHNPHAHVIVTTLDKCYATPGGAVIRP